MVEALGHNVPRVFMLVFGGLRDGGLAGVTGGITFVTEPNMANIGPIIFAVVVVGGMGSLPGAFVGLAADRHPADALPLTVDKSLGQPATVRLDHRAGTARWPVLVKITLAQTAPILPHLLLVLILIFRPRACWARRED